MIIIVLYIRNRCMWAISDWNVNVQIELIYNFEIQRAPMRQEGAETACTLTAYGTMTVRLTACCSPRDKFLDSEMPAFVPACHPGSGCAHPTPCRPEAALRRHQWPIVVPSRQFHYGCWGVPPRELKKCPPTSFSLQVSEWLRLRDMLIYQVRCY